MEKHTVFTVQADIDDALLIDMDYTGVEGRTRSVVAYRASDSYGPLTPLITQWLTDHPDQEILPYIPAPEPTPEELRALMSALTPRQFRDALIDAGIMPEQVTAAIAQILDEKQRAKAMNAWKYPTQFTRTDQLIDEIGAMFSLTPEAIDVMWNAASA
jgi:hypothetical protein